MVHHHNSGSAIRIFIVHNESSNNGLYQKKFVQDKWAHPHICGTALRIFSKFCRMKGANRYMKILLVVFREKKSFGAIDLFSLEAIFYCLIGHGRN